MTKKKNKILIRFSSYILALLMALTILQGEQLVTTANADAFTPPSTITLKEFDVGSGMWSYESGFASCKNVKSLSFTMSVDGEEVPGLSLSREGCLGYACMGKTWAYVDEYTPSQFTQPWLDWLYGITSSADGKKDTIEVKVANAWVQLVLWADMAGEFEGMGRVEMIAAVGAERHRVLNYYGVGEKIGYTLENCIKDTQTIHENWQADQYGNWQYFKYEFGDTVPGIYEGKSVQPVVIGKRVAGKAVG